MLIEELGISDSVVRGGKGERFGLVEDGERKGLLEAKRAMVGVGARILFYPTLMYNVLRNKMESEFHWWDKIDEFILLGAVPFPSDVPRLKEVGVRGVITLTESYETLVPTSLYHANRIDHLVIPTRDYLFAPSFEDICQAVDFIDRNASSGKVTYVHCKAGRGRSTTIVLCYLVSMRLYWKVVHHRQMTPTTAFEYVKQIRPRVLLASAQWQAVVNYYHIKVKKFVMSLCFGIPLLRSPTISRSTDFMVFDDSSILNSPTLPTSRNIVTLNDTSFIVISDTDLDGYVENGASYVGNAILTELSLVYKMQIFRQAAIARLSYFWIRCHPAKQTTLLLNNVERRDVLLRLGN